ncbi:hypothetical protein [Sedimentibacter sp. B4]|uniref:hypothetical protein n=1 Tax=Sedimentibacter sp. B4 TaxID=304766 RepID=UPI0002D8BA53|nr:hypothetical protein [Sedimentibacter sp. B4]
MNEKLFELIKQVYTESREGERLKIVDYLEKCGYKVKKRGLAGKGVKKYISGGQLIKPFDLTNWKWIEITKDGREFLVSLQPPDKDPSSGNHHVLMDRIGVYSNGHWIITDIDLPMDEKSLNALVEIINGWN